MGKVKSAIVFTLITLIIAVLCVVCFVPFPLGGGIHYFNPIINWTEKSADFGGYQFGEEAAYQGGSYGVVFYPEGVISAAEYTDNLDGKPEEEKEEYSEKYVVSEDGKLYFEKETVCKGKDVPSDEFKASVEKQYENLKERFARLHGENVTFEVADEYTFRATLPATEPASVAAFLYFSYMGEVTLSYGTSSDAASATQVLPSATSGKPIGDYIKSVTAHNNAGNVYVRVDFTKEGLDLVGSATSGAADSTGYLFLNVGDNTVINLSVSESVHDDLYISGSYTAESARIVAATLDTAIGNGCDLGMTLGSLYRVPANYGTLSLGSLTLQSIDLVYIAFAVLFVAMLVFFFVRYRMLAFVQLYTYLVFLLAMVLIYWAVPITIGVGSLTAFALASLLLSFSNAVAFEYARKEYAVGKTIESSVKTGYKKCFWHIFDLHIVLLIVALLVYLIALSELSVFGLAFLFGVALSGIGTLALNRFLWHVTLQLSKNPGKFCHYAREEVEDDE